MPPSSMLATTLNMNVSAMAATFAASFSASGSDTQELSGMSFKSIFESRTVISGSADIQQSTSAANTVKQTDAMHAGLTAKVKQSGAVQETTGTVKTADTQSDVPDEELLEEAGKVLDSIKAQICDVLNISEEELEDFLAENGLTDASLLSASVLTNLVLDVNDNAQAAQLLTDENMSNQLNSILTLVNEQVNAFAKENPQIENLTDVFAQAADKAFLQTQQGQQNDGLELTDEESVQQKTDENLAKDDKLIVVKDDTDTGKTQEQKSAQAALADEEQKQLTESTKGSDSAQTEENDSLVLKTAATKDTADTGSDNKESGQSKGQPETMFEHFTNRLMQTAVQDADPAQQLQMTARFQEIIDQLTQQIKVTVSQSQTSLDMQLNPEHLGRVNLNLTSKDGVMTAQLTTQTQVAKEAIESQIHQLRETIESQGVKVEAIEVTVSSFAFSQSKDTQSQAGSQQSQSRGSKRSDGIAASAGDASDESAKLAQIRQSVDGSTVDYVA